MTTLWIALLVFGLLVIFHEFGHFGIAKLVGIKVHEFAIGMGPRILKIKGKETEYSVRILPIGGYVRMEGEDETSADARSFNNKPLWARILVIVAGPLMNFILAILLFIMIFYSLGFPTTTIQNVKPGFPAKEAGVHPGDEVIAIDGKTMSSWDQVVQTISQNNSKTVEMTLLRKGHKKNIHMVPVMDQETNRAIIGISPSTEKSFIKSIKVSIDRTLFVMDSMMDFFKKIFAGKASTKDVVGPVGIIHLVGEAAKTNIYNVLSLAALISINLGIVNLLPIPALDGGRLVFLIIEGIIGRPLDPEKEGLIHLTGFVLLMGLMLFMIYKDILRFY